MPLAFMHKQSTGIGTPGFGQVNTQVSDPNSNVNLMPPSAAADNVRLNLGHSYTVGGKGTMAGNWGGLKPGVSPATKTRSVPAGKTVSTGAFPKQGPINNYQERLEKLTRISHARLSENVNRLSRASSGPGHGRQSSADDLSDQLR